MCVRLFRCCQKGLAWKLMKVKVGELICVGER